MNARAIILCVLFLICTACMGDGLLIIKGQVVDMNYKSIENCSLAVHLAEDGRLLRTQPIESRFEADFGIAPTTYDYFFIIRCPDFPGDMYKTGVYKISGSKYSKAPLDLGRVVIGGPKS